MNYGEVEIKCDRCKRIVKIKTAMTEPNSRTFM